MRDRLDALESLPITTPRPRPLRWPPVAHPTFRRFALLTAGDHWAGLPACFVVNTWGVSPPLITVRGATAALTRRTTMRKAFLGPWHPMVEKLWLYSLADAQANTDVAVHLSTLVVNHHHTDVTPSQANLSEFTRRLHGDFSEALNKLLSDERYDTRPSTGTSTRSSTTWTGSLTTAGRSSATPAMADP